MPPTWWLRNPRYVIFVLRELSGLFLMVFGVVYLLQLAFLAVGPGAYEGYIAALHALILLFALVHTLTWLYLTSRILELRFGRR